MISVLIVDDEYLIRSLIRNSIPWAKLGMEVIGEAKNGEEALAFIADHRPQIALVDINMPILNGLELAQKVQEQQYHTHIIFLTGYRDFEYAKQAVTYQAFDYLLKPISTEEMTATLVRLCQKIGAEQKLTSYVRTIEHKSDIGKRLLQEHYLHQLSFGRLQQSSMQIAAELQRLEIDLAPETLMAFVVEVDIRNIDRDDGLYAYAVLNILCELLQKDGTFHHINSSSEVDNCVVILCNVNACSNLEQRIRQIWEQLTIVIRTHFSFTLFGGVSEVFNGYDAISTGVKSAITALDGHFYQKESNIFFAGSSPNSIGLAEIFSSVSLDELQISIDAGEREEGHKIIQDIFQKMQQEHVQESFFRIAALGLLAILYSLSTKYNLSPDCIQVGNIPISEQIDKSTTSQEIESLLLDCYERFMDSLQKSRKVSKLVCSAEIYIKEHYHLSDLSLKKVAASIFVTPAYISSLFKKEMGVSVTEYITICRMKKAIELLNRDSELTLTSISELVGYTDPYYFSRCFKKYYGITPSKMLASRSKR